MYQELKSAPAVKVQAAIEEEPFLSKEVPPARELIDRAWAAYKRRALTISAIQLAILGGYTLTIAISVILLKRLYHAYDKLFHGGYEWIYIPSPGEAITGLAMIILSFIMVFACVAVDYLITLYGGLVMAYAISDERLGLVEAFGKARKKLVPYALISLWRDFLISLGSIIFLPGLLFRVKYAFSPFIYALENERGMKVLAKSSAYAAASPAIFRRLLIVELLKSFPRLFDQLVLHGASLLIFGPVLFFSFIMLGFFIGIFALIGISYGIYIEIYSVFMAKMLIYLPVFLALFFLPAFLMLYYFQIYKSARALKEGNNEHPV